MGGKEDVDRAGQAARGARAPRLDPAKGSGDRSRDRRGVLLSSAQGVPSPDCSPARGPRRPAGAGGSLGRDLCFRQEDFGEGRRGRGGGGGGGGRAGPGSGPGAMADPEERLGLEPEDSGGMDPDHPLLARAQAALKAQLVTARENVESELREKHESLRVRDLSGDARTCAHLADHPAPFTRGAPTPGALGQAGLSSPPQAPPGAQRAPLPPPLAYALAPLARPRYNDWARALHACSRTLAPGSLRGSDQRSTGRANERSAGSSTAGKIRSDHNRSQWG